MESSQNRSSRIL